MYKLAFVSGNTLVYWHAIILALAVLTGMLFFVATYYRKTGDFRGAAVACPTAFLFSLFFSRLAHWFFRPDGYDGLASAMSSFLSSGYALIGVFAGCLLAACLLGVLRAIESLPAMLDCMCIGGSAAIALGRLSCLFTPDDRGTIIGTSLFPLAYPVVNSTSGALEYRFATFFFQAVVAALLFATLLVMHNRSLRKRPRRKGDITMLFLLFYCASQIVLDSTRYDSLHLRSNGFVSVAQVAGAVCIVVVVGILSGRLIRRNGFMPLLPLFWVLTAGALTCAGFMEYYVQRHGDQALIAYSVMSFCLCTILFIGVLMLNLTYRKARKQPTRRAVKEGYHE